MKKRDFYQFLSGKPIFKWLLLYPGRRFFAVSLLVDGQCPSRMAGFTLMDLQPLSLNCLIQVILFVTVKWFL